MLNQAHGQKNFAGCFSLPPQPNDHSKLRPGYPSIRFLGTKCTVAGLETYSFSHSQSFASGLNLNSQIAVSNSQLVFPTFEQFLTLRCGMAIVSWG